MQKITPVSTQEREIFMDVLRGLAILGIFIANLNGFSWYNPERGVTGPMLIPEADRKMAFLHHMFLEGKFYSIFSLLFGWGIALQLKRAQEKGIIGIALLRRRLAFMLLLGMVHLLIWPGDIVFFYALLGFILLPLRKLSNKVLLILGIILILSPIALYAAKMNWLWLNAPAELMYKTGIRMDAALNGSQSEEDLVNLLKNGSWWDNLKANISGFFFRYGYLFFVSRVPKVLGMFLIGYALGRSAFYKNFDRNKKIIYFIIGGGLLLGIPANYYLAHLMSNHMNDYWDLKAKGLYQTIAYAVGVAPLAMAYVGLMMLAFQSRMGRKILTPLAPAGKMAFSNYMLQSLIGNFIFLGAGLGYMGQMGPVYYTVLGLIVFIFQVIISRIWLNYFNYGPVEWLWRSATYGKCQKISRASGH